MTSGSWRVHADPAAAASLRSRPLVKLTSVAVVGLVCLLGCVALHHHAQVHTTNVVASASSAGFERVSAAAVVPVPVQARKQFLAEAQSEAEVTIPDIAGHFNDAQQTVSRKELREVSEMISTAIRANKNHMDVRILQQTLPTGDGVRPCGPKKPSTNAPKVPRRPCIKISVPPTCQLCATYTIKATDTFAATVCSGLSPALTLANLNSVLLNNYPALFGLIGQKTPVCSTFKIDQQNYYKSGPYCVGPVDPKDYPAIKADMLDATTKLSKKMADVTAKANPSDVCTAPVTAASTSTVVGMEKEELVITLVCEDSTTGQTLPALGQADLYTTSCPT